VLRRRNGRASRVTFTKFFMESGGGSCTRLHILLFLIALKSDLQRRATRALLRTMPHCRLYERDCFLDVN